MNIIKYWKELAKFIEANSEVIASLLILLVALGVLILFFLKVKTYLTKNEKTKATAPVSPKENLPESKKRFVIALKGIGSSTDSGLLCEQWEKFLMRRFRVRLLDFPKGIESKGFFIRLRRVLEQSEACIFVVGNVEEACLDDLIFDSYKFAFVSGINSHFVVLDSILQKFKSTQAYNMEREVSPVNRILSFHQTTHNDPVDCYFQIQDLLMEICPQQYGIRVDKPNKEKLEL